MEFSGKEVPRHGRTIRREKRYSPMRLRACLRVRAYRRLLRADQGARHLMRAIANSSPTPTVSVIVGLDMGRSRFARLKTDGMGGTQPEGLLAAHCRSGRMSSDVFPHTVHRYTFRSDRLISLQSVVFLSAKLCLNNRPSDSASLSMPAAKRRHSAASFVHPNKKPASKSGLLQNGDLYLRLGTGLHRMFPAQQRGVEFHDAQFLNCRAKSKATPRPNTRTK